MGKIALKYEGVIKFFGKVFLLKMSMNIIVLSTFLVNIFVKNVNEYYSVIKFLGKYFLGKCIRYITVLSIFLVKIKMQLQFLFYVDFFIFVGVMWVLSTFFGEYIFG